MISLGIFLLLSSQLVFTLLLCLHPEFKEHRFLRRLVKALLILIFASQLAGVSYLLATRLPSEGTKTSISKGVTA